VVTSHGNERVLGFLQVRGVLTCEQETRLHHGDSRRERPKGSVRMNDVIGIAWYKDEVTYRRALAIFIDSKNMPATYEDWQAIVRREREEIKGAGNVALRVDIDPETFKDWCNGHGFLLDARGRTAFVNHVELEYEKTGKGTVIE